MMSSNTSNAPDNTLSTVTTEPDNAGSHQSAPKPHKAPWLAKYAWQRGKSGNPTGRRKGETSIVAAIKRQLAKGENLNAVAKAIVQGAIQGDGQCMKLLLDRIDGAVTKELSAHIQGQLSAPIVGQVVFNIPDNHRDTIEVSAQSVPQLPQSADNAS